jgi:hypothetical protein
MKNRSLMASGAVRWFSPMTSSVGSKTNTSGASYDLEDRNRPAKSRSHCKALIPRFLNALPRLMKNSSHLKLSNSAAYDALCEFFHAICRVLLEIGAALDHVRK